MNYRSLALCTCLLLPSACGDDSDPGAGEPGTDTDANPTTDGSSSQTATDPTTAGPTGSTTASSDSDSAQSSSTSDDETADTSTGSLPSEVALGGIVRDFLGVVPVEAAELSVYGMDDVTAVSAADGSFTFEGMEPDTPISLVLAPIDGGGDDLDYAGSVIPERTGTADRMDVDAPMVQLEFIRSQIGTLEPQNPEPVDLDQAIIIVLAPSEAVMAGPVAIDMEPPPAAGTFYAADAGGSPVLDSSEIGFATVPAAVFFNVGDTDPGDISVTATHDSGLLDCIVDHEQWPTLGRHITIVTVSCE